MSEILPLCPFNDPSHQGKAVPYIDKSTDENGELWQVRCGYCDAAGPVAETEQQAIDGWNSGRPSSGEQRPVASSVCPICGQDTPHNHGVDPIAWYTGGGFTRAPEIHWGKFRPSLKDPDGNETMSGWIPMFAHPSPSEEDIREELLKWKGEIQDELIARGLARPEFENSPKAALRCLLDDERKHLGAK